MMKKCCGKGGDHIELSESSETNVGLTGYKENQGGS